MPAWQDIKPARIAAQLPIIWSYSYDQGTDEFTGRLAGDRIVQVFHSAGPVYKQRDRFEHGERIVLPLGPGGLPGNGVLGATEYHRAQFVPGVEIEPVAQKEEWFSLVA